MEWEENLIYWDGVNDMLEHYKENTGELFEALMNQESDSLKLEVVE